MLNGTWRPELGKDLLHQVSYSQLVAIADARTWSKKTYNDAISILRQALDFAYRDHPEQHNPARSLRSARLKKKDHPKIDPFSLHAAEEAQPWTATLVSTPHMAASEASALTVQYSEVDVQPTRGAGHPVVFHEYV